MMQCLPRLGPGLCYDLNVNFKQHLLVAASICLFRNTFPHGPESCERLDAIFSIKYNNPMD